jgi:hypothetical protein
MNRRLYLKGCAAFGFACIGLSGFFSKQSLAITMDKDPPNPKQLKFSFALRNSSNLELRNQFLWVSMPVNSRKQHLKKLDASIHYELVTDTLNQNYIEFIFPAIGPLSTKLVSVTAQVDRLSKSELDVTNPVAWMQPELLLESNNFQIEILAQQLKQSNDADTCYAIYKWVSENIIYSGYIADNLGALYALNHLKGDCTEYACLAVALARANGIPSRMVGGYVTDKDAIIRAKDYHHWAEVYLDRQWILLDAQKKNWLDGDADYIAFNYYQTQQQTPIGSGNRYKLSDGLKLIY